MNLNIDKKRNDYASLSSKLSSTKNLDFTTYYNPQGPNLNRPDLPDYNAASTRVRNPSSHLFASVQNLPKKLNISASVTATMSPPVGALSTNSASPSQFDFRNIRSDASLVPPIRQTASIFKQPVTVIKTQEGKVKSDLKHGAQEKPKQLFWEKRLENFQACDSEGTEFTLIDLPKQLKPVGPHVKDQTLFQSVATALHSSMHPVTGQTSSKTALTTNPGVFVNPDQPLLYACSITEDDIRKQEDRVQLARKKLQEALAN